MKKSRMFQNPTQCPVIHAMGIIGGRWKPVIINCLISGKMRFGKLSGLIPTISRKILAEQLKELESYGVIKREEFKELPPKVEYSLTAMGETLTPVIMAIHSWGRQHQDISDAQNVAI